MKRSDSNIAIRITALWAFSEAFLGGVLHGFQIPFAGLVLSLVAALCMSVLAVCGENRGGILKATIAVLAVKFILSPHTPPMAYVAVLVEGLAGELFFLQRRYINTGAFLLTLFSLLYSASQHLIILTIVFGKNFWIALDVFLNGITKTFVSKPQHYSLYLVVFYIGCYLVAGIAGGILNIRIIKKIRSGFVPQVLLEAKKLFSITQAESNNPVVTKKRRTAILFVISIALLVILILSYTTLFNNTFLQNKIGEILIRGVIIIIVLNYLIAPLVIRWIGKMVAGYQRKQNNQLHKIIALLPEVRKIVQVSWQHSRNLPKMARFRNFLTHSLLLIVYAGQPDTTIDR